jgi:hypothetical protein
MICHQKGMHERSPRTPQGKDEIHKVF